MIYEFVDTGLLIVDLRCIHILYIPETKSSNKSLINQSHFSTDIDVKFYEMPAMVNQNWKNTFALKIDMSSLDTLAMVFIMY
jgi:hypothetical protein